MTDDLDHVEEKIERAGSETLNRMALLVQKGYKPSFSEPMDAIWLHHPRYSFKHKLVSCMETEPSLPVMGQTSIVLAATKKEI